MTGMKWKMVVISGGRGAQACGSEGPTGVAGNTKVLVLKQGCGYTGVHFLRILYIVYMCFMYTFIYFL